MKINSIFLNYYIYNKAPYSIFKISFSSNFLSHLAFLGGESVNWMAIIMMFSLWINHIVMRNPTRAS
jgi:hypothetical protein